YMDEHAVQVEAHGTLTVTDWVKATTSPDPAQYWVTGVWYPAEWHFTFGPEVPADIRTFSMHPIVDSGSALFSASGHQYQEAPVDIRDSKGDVVGSGYAEAVSYADGLKWSLRNRLTLAGLPTTNKMLALLEPPPISPELQAASAAYLADPAHQAALAHELATCIGLGTP